MGAGLISSTFHLGHPERAWRAFSQWRSSWLSREGVLSVATFVPAGLLATCWVFYGLIPIVLVIPTIVLALATVSADGDDLCQPEAGATLGQRLCAAELSLAGLASGAAWLALITAIVLPGLLRHDHPRLDRDPRTRVCRLGQGRLLALYRSQPERRDTESATGLGGIGKVRLFAAPHTEENYLLKEMGYKVARKHALKLRLIALGLGFTAPAILVFLATYFTGWAAVLLLLLATIGNAIGTLDRALAVLRRSAPHGDALLRIRNPRSGRSRGAL